MKQILIAGSRVRYNAQHGAMRVTATRATLVYEFINVNNQVIDRFVQLGRCAGGVSYLPFVRK